LLNNLLGRVSPFWRGVLQIANTFKLGLRLNYEQGTSVKFYTDCRIGEVPLAYAFASLFDVASNKDAWVNSQIQDNDWALSFCPPLSPARLQDLAGLMDILRMHTFWDGPDQITWKAGSSFVFTISSQYRLLQPSLPKDRAAKYLWKVTSPLKVKITTWLAI